MPKNRLLALGLGVGLWMVMFLGVFALIVSPLSDLIQKIGEIVLAGVAAFVLAKIYFKKSPGDLKDGVVLWLAWLILGTILDLLITIWFVKGSGSYVSGLKAFYGMWSVWVSFVVMLAGVGLAAKTTHGGELMKKPPQQPPASPSASSSTHRDGSQDGPVQQPPITPSPPSSTPPMV